MQLIKRPVPTATYTATHQIPAEQDTDNSRIPENKPATPPDNREECGASAVDHERVGLILAIV